MGIVWHLALKDIRLLVRDKMGLFWALGFPFMTALFFGLLFGGSGQAGRGMKIGIVDDDDSPGSAKFIKLLSESPSLATWKMTLGDAQTKVRKGELTAYLRIKEGFGESAGFFGAGADSAGIEVGMDPARKAEEGFLQGILMQTAVQLMQERFSDSGQVQKQIDRAKENIAKAANLNAIQRGTLGELMDSLGKWSKQMPDNQADRSFNMAPMKLESKSIVKDEAAAPRSSFDITFPQGIMWGILGTITTFAVGLAMERNNGTLLRLRLAPITYTQILAGKALACFLMCILIVAILLTVGKLFFGVRFDNLALLSLAVVCSGVCYTGIMMLLSTLGKTERAVSGVGWGVLMPLTMIGGGTIPVFFMPEWLRNLSHLSPIKWSILGMEGGIWRSFSLGEMLLPCGIQLAIGIFCFFLGVAMVRKLEG